MAAGQGGMKPDKQKAYVASLQKHAGPRQKAVKATAGDLARLGIPVKEV